MHNLSALYCQLLVSPNASSIYTKTHSKKCDIHEFKEIDYHHWLVLFGKQDPISQTSYLL